MKLSHLVQVDDWAMQLVSLQVISSHADFTKVTGMVLVEVDSVREVYPDINRLLLLDNSYLRFSSLKPLTCGDAARRRYRDHRDACGAFRRDRDRGSRGLSTFWSSWASLSTFLKVIFLSKTKLKTRIKMEKIERRGKNLFIRYMCNFWNEWLIHV